MNVRFEVVDHFHELFLTDSKISQNSCPFFPVLSNIIKYRLGKILYHVFGLCLTLPEVLFHLHWAVFIIRKRSHIWIFHKSSLIWNMRSRIILVLNNFNIVANVRATSIQRWTWTTDILIVELSITRYLSSLERIVNASWAADRAWEPFVQLLIQSVLSLKKFGDKHMLRIDNLHHLISKAQIT